MVSSRRECQFRIPFLRIWNPRGFSFLGTRNPLWLLVLRNSEIHSEFSQNGRKGTPLHDAVSINRISSVAANLFLFSCMFTYTAGSSSFSLSLSIPIEHACFFSSQLLLFAYYKHTYPFIFSLKHHLLNQIHYLLLNR